MMHALLHVGLVNAVLAALVAVVVALLALLFRGRPALVHGLWLMVLLKLVTPPLVVLPLPWPAEVSEAPMMVEEERNYPYYLALPPPALQVDASGGPSDVLPGGRAEQAVAAEQIVAAEVSEPWWPVLLLALWLAGALVHWSVAGVRLLRLCRVLREIPPADGDVQERVAELQRRLGLRRGARAFFLPGVMPPMMLALGRTPRLLLPAGLWERLDDTQRDTLLLHELAHLRRGDHWVRWLELVVLGLYWWHPVASWASRALHDAEEQCCDAWVVWAAPAAAGAYATTLVEAVAFLSAGPAALPAGASGAGPVRLIKRRLTMILHQRTPRSLSWPAWAGVLLLGGGLLPLMPTLARSEAGEPPAPKEPTKMEDVARKVLLSQKACIACHEPVSLRPKKAEPMKLHDEVVRLLDERRALQQKLNDTEARLRAALARFETEQGKKPAGASEKGKEASEKRLEHLEKSLKRILEEVESLRRELRPGRQAPPAPALEQTIYINRRSFRLPVKLNWDKVKPGMLCLYVSSDGGRTWAQYAKTSYPQDYFSFEAKHDGEYSFIVQLGSDGDPQNEQPSRQTKLTLFVDTKKPVIEMSVGKSGKDRGRIEWKVGDENLDLTTLKVEYLAEGQAEWLTLPVERTPRGRYLLPASSKAGEVRVSVADKAGNRETRRMKLE